MMKIIFYFFLIISNVNARELSDCDILNQIRSNGLTLAEFHSATFSVSNSCDPRLLHPLWAKTLAKQLSLKEKKEIIKKICGPNFTLKSKFTTCLTGDSDLENILMLEEENPAVALMKLNKIKELKEKRFRLVQKVLGHILN